MSCLKAFISEIHHIYLSSFSKSYSIIIIFDFLLLLNWWMLISTSFFYQFIIFKLSFIILPCILYNSGMSIKHIIFKLSFNYCMTFLIFRTFYQSTNSISYIIFVLSCVSAMFFIFDVYKWTIFLFFSAQIIFKWESR